MLLREGFPRAEIEAVLASARGPETLRGAAVPFGVALLLLPGGVTLLAFLLLWFMNDWVSILPTTTFQAVLGGAWLAGSVAGLYLLWRRGLVRPLLRATGLSRDDDVVGQDGPRRH